MEFRFLALEDVLDLHEMQLESYGGATGIREQSLLESALMTPQASFGGELVHNGVFELAAAYAFHIAENQPFLDGNKRTALAAALVFLDWNHIEISDPNEELYDAMISLAKKTLDKAGLAKLFQKLSH
ncbi:MAG: type II toxin-antitoxin system death-on-curing family toxin [Bdellovibrionota bacterium]